MRGNKGSGSSGGGGGGGGRGGGGSDSAGPFVGFAAKGRCHGQFQDCHDGSGRVVLL